LPGSLFEVSENVPEIRISQAQFQPEQRPPDASAPAAPVVSPEAAGVRSFLLARGNSAMPTAVFTG
jgi:hypothetical protein